MDTFVRIRQLQGTHKDPAHKLVELEESTTPGFASSLTPSAS